MKQNKKNELIERIVGQKLQGTKPKGPCIYSPCGPVPPLPKCKDKCIGPGCKVVECQKTCETICVS